MKKITIVIIALFLTSSFLKADETPLYTKQDINSIASGFVYNNLGVKNPAVVDIDYDGKFDILNFAADGNVEFYKNTGTNESPVFTLEDPNYSNVKVHKMFKGMPVPVFFADATGNGKPDVFAIMGSKYDASTQTIQHDIAYHQNALNLNHYTLITIILVLVIVVLIITIL